MAYLDKINVSGTNYDLGKPIYYHGIRAYHTTKKNYVSLVVLNTSSTLIDSVAKLKQWAENITGDVYIQVNGQIDVDDDSSFKQAILLIKPSNNQWFLAYFDSTGYDYKYNIDLADYFDTVSDGCNQINL